MEFRVPAVGRVLRLVVYALPAVAGVGIVAANLLRHRPWPYYLAMVILVGLSFLGVMRWNRMQRPHHPLLLTEESLELPGPGGVQVTIDWTNIARAQVMGRLSPRLVVQPEDPRLVRPTLTPWQWAAASGRRPYEIVVPLSLTQPDRLALEAELARRLARSRQTPP